MLSRLFGFDPLQHTVRTEIIAGITTFLTMAYILAVNPSIFGALAAQGMPTGAVFTATALASIVGTLIMAFYAKKPFGLAPGMGLNAFFVFTVCLGMGFSWQFALTAVFLEGVIFIILTITRIRQIMIEAIPPSLKIAIGAGIGLFIAFLGLRAAGLVVGNQATLVALGSFSDKTTLLAVFGIFVTSILLISKVRGALLIGILATTVLGIPLGITHINGLVDTPPSVEPILLKFEWDQIFTLDMIVVVMTLLFMDVFDTVGTLIGVSNKLGLIKPNGDSTDLNKALLTDAVATVASACLGTNTTTTYVESVSGIAEGGRTGLTAFVVALCFAVALFFAPLFLAIPTQATAPILILVGVFMIEPLAKLDFHDFSETIPAFMTMLLMPLTCSINIGILIGVISYVVLNLFTGKITKLNPTLILLAIIFVMYFAFLGH